MSGELPTGPRPGTRRPFAAAPRAICRESLSFFGPPTQNDITSCANAPQQGEAMSRSLSSRTGNGLAVCGMVAALAAIATLTSLGCTDAAAPTDDDTSADPGVTGQLGAVSVLNATGDGMAYFLRN